MDEKFVNNTNKKGASHPENSKRVGRGHAKPRPNDHLARGGGRSEGRGGEKKAAGCFSCGEVGHVANKCPKRGTGPKTKFSRGKQPFPHAREAKDRVAAATAEDLQRLLGEIDGQREKIAELENVIADRDGLPAAVDLFNDGKGPDDLKEVPKPAPEAAKQEEIPVEQTPMRDWSIEYAEAPRMFYGWWKYVSFVPLFLVVLAMGIYLHSQGDSASWVLFLLLSAALASCRRFKPWDRLNGLRSVQGCLMNGIPNFSGAGFIHLTLEQVLVGLLAWPMCYLDVLYILYFTYTRPSLFIGLVVGPSWKFGWTLATLFYSLDPIAFWVGLAVLVSVISTLVYLWWKSLDNFIKHSFRAISARQHLPEDCRADWMLNQDLKHKNPLYYVIKYEKLFCAFGFEVALASREFLVSGELFAQCASMRHLAILDARVDSMARVEAGVRKMGTINIDRYLAFDGHDVMQMTCLLIYAHGESLKEKAALLPFPMVGLH